MFAGRKFSNFLSFSQSLLFSKKNSLKGYIANIISTVDLLLSVSLGNAIFLKFNIDSQIWLSTKQLVLLDIWNGFLGNILPVVLTTEISVFL